MVAATARIARAIILSLQQSKLTTTPTIDGGWLFVGASKYFQTCGTPPLFIDYTVLFNLAWLLWKPFEAEKAREDLETMAQQTSTPQQLTPQFCFSTRDLKDFLRISRSSIDDSITQHLNSLLTPSTTGFDASSTINSIRTLPRRQISPKTCQAFKNNVLFPSWQTRSDVLNYCASVATSPDPDDPESLLKQVESDREREKVVDERLDPYSARRYVREGRTEVLASILRQERGVENIVRARSWSLVNERCGRTDSNDWEQALDDWRKKRT
ncbi:hypothetical protein BP6252_09919 [Coleophoma cylindrospora]|uniref:Caffeine-induced death protein Cid2 n=1 Tax=Coleophoma cylindrospora TaxID=1849047 RepID=A0A3D8QXL9_9HELO|nr:hypothetical protein BP6252_09919 [Coleophoma cylindrospora]